MTARASICRRRVAIAAGIGILAAVGFGCDRPPSQPGPGESVVDPDPPAPPDAKSGAGSDSPSRTPPPTPPADAKVARFHGLVAPKPVTWIWHPPMGSMRTANWNVPGRDGSDMAELVVFQFPRGEGGTIEENIDRWASRFRAGDDVPVVPLVLEIQVPQMSVTFVELSGEHMKVGAGWFTPDQMQFGAIVERPEGLVFIRLTGPVATLEVHRAAFMRMIRGLRPDDGGS